MIWLNHEFFKVKYVLIWKIECSQKISMGYLWSVVTCPFDFIVNHWIVLSPIWIILEVIWVSMHRHKLTVSVSIIWPVLESHALPIIFAKVHAFENWHVNFETIIGDIFIYAFINFIGAIISYDLVWHIDGFCDMSFLLVAPW